MATAQEKLQEMETAVGGLKTSIEGITADVSQYKAKAEADAAEIASLKDAVTAAQSAAGELSPELAARFDALSTSLKDTAQKAADLDAQLTQVAETLPEPAPGNETETPTPTDSSPTPEPSPTGDGTETNG